MRFNAVCSSCVANMPITVKEIRRAVTMGGVMYGVLPLRLLQVHRPSGEPQCIAVVGIQAKSGDFLVNGSEPSHSMICSSLTLESKQ